MTEILKSHRLHRAQNPVRTPRTPVPPGIPKGNRGESTVNSRQLSIADYGLWTVDSHFTAYLCHSYLLDV